MLSVPQVATFVCLCLCQKCPARLGGQQDHVAVALHAWRRAPQARAHLDYLDILTKVSVLYKSYHFPGALHRARKNKSPFEPTPVVNSNIAVVGLERIAFTHMCFSRQGLRVASASSDESWIHNRSCAVNATVYTVAAAAASTSAMMCDRDCG